MGNTQGIMGTDRLSFAIVLVPSAPGTMAFLRSSILALTAVLTLTLPASAQQSDLPRIDPLGSYPDLTRDGSSAPHDVRWEERLPALDPQSTSGTEDDPSRWQTADLGDLEGIFAYRFVGEHRGSRTGLSITFSNDMDCDGFVEVVIGAPTFYAVPDEVYFDEPGAVYVVSMADVQAADAADGAADRVIDLGLVAAQPRSWKLTSEGLHYVGGSVASGGDVHGDGCPDLLIGGRGHDAFTGSAYVVSAFDLPAADAADGAADGVVDIRRTADQPNSWELTGEASGDHAGSPLIFAGDVNGDRRSDLLIAAAGYGEDFRGAVYLLSGVALSSADAEDGVADGRIELASVAAQPDSWMFVGETAEGFAGHELSAANLESDGRSDLVIVAYGHTAGLDRQGAVYLVAASDLTVIDAADGDLDGLIDLAHVVSGRASWKLVGSLENQQVGARGVATGDVDGDGLDDVIIANPEVREELGEGRARTTRGSEVYLIAARDLTSADASDGATDRVVALDRALAQDDSFKLVWGLDSALSVSSDVDIDGDGLDDVLVGNTDYDDGPGCLPGGGARGDGAVALIPGGPLHGADAADGVADSIIDLDHIAWPDGFWKFIGEPTDRLGSAVAGGDIDGDGRDDLLLASYLNHTPDNECGSWVSTGYAFSLAGAHLEPADALDGTADREIHLDALRVEVDREPLVVREVTQFEDSVVEMRISGSLKTAEFDFDALSRRFYSHYDDEFDYLIFISNLPTVDFSRQYSYDGIHMGVSNTVRGTGRPIRDSEETLKAIIHFPYRHAILEGPSLHEIMHSWANYAVPTTEPLHWGFSSANGQLGGFDLANLVELGNGRYSAGWFGTFANGGNSLPYSPIELYFAGLIPPEEVPDLWVATDGEWSGEEDESGNPIFEASDIETWSVRRIVTEQGARVPDWRSSQKSFRAAVVLLTDHAFPAAPTILRELREALRSFSHAGGDGDDYSFNFWEATGGRATLRTDGLRGSGLPFVANRSPVPLGGLGPLTLRVDEPDVAVEVSGAFRDPDGDVLSYGAMSSSPTVAALRVSGSSVTVTPVSVGTATVTVTATDVAGSNTTAMQAFRVRVMASLRDEVIRPGVTPVRAVHFMDLRARIDALRSETGLGRFVWTDPVLTAGVTPVRLVHLLELRSALGAAYAAAGRGTPAWTDATPVVGTTVIRAMHLQELRLAVRALE